MLRAYAPPRVLRAADCAVGFIRPTRQRQLLTRLLQPFILAVTLVLGAAFAYVAWRLTYNPWQRIALAVPFLLVWMVPAVYWAQDRDTRGPLDDWMHRASYLSMAWLSFLFVFSLLRDVLLLLAGASPAISGAHEWLLASGVPLVYAASLAALIVGALAAMRGPHVRHVDIVVDGLAPALDGFRIAQISDLHVGLNIRRPYVERVVEKTQALAPDLIALTGDIVDGPIARIGHDVEPLAELTSGGRAFFILGNHDCYSGARPWMAHFAAMGMRVLANSHEIVSKDGATMVVGGVVDPAARLYDRSLAPRPDTAAAGSPPGDFRLLLAHNPKLAPLGAAAGWHLQLSGHTHAGQFFPWTLVIHLFHKQHVAGLSREGKMWVYVGAGTGTWGPPVRVGTEPELTLIRLVRA